MEEEVLQTVAAQLSAAIYKDKLGANEAEAKEIVDIYAEVLGELRRRFGNPGSTGMMHHIGKNS